MGKAKGKKRKNRREDEVGKVEKGGSGKRRRG